MLIKDCDSREYDVLVLETLAQNTALTSMERYRALQELNQIRAHRARMQVVASQLNMLLGDRNDWIVLHDLRMDDDARGLEFDHLLINRWLQVWVLDSRCFDLSLAITSFGDVVASQRPSVLQTPGQSVTSQSVGRDGSRQREALISPDSGRQALLAHSPLLAIPERKQAFLRWWSSSGLLPQKLGVTLFPQLIQRIVLAEESQISRPPEDIVDTHALVSLSALRGECLQRNGRSAAISRLRSFTHRISVNKLRDIGMALAELHHVPRIDWAERLELSSTELPLNAPSSEFRWRPPERQATEWQEEDSDQVCGTAEVHNALAETSSSSTLSFSAFLATLKKGHASLQAVPETWSTSSTDDQRSISIERSSSQGLKASDWLGSPASSALDDASGRGGDTMPGTQQEYARQEGTGTFEHGSIACQPDMGSQSGQTDGVGKPRITVDEVVDRVLRCDGCRRWLSRDSLRRYREAPQQSTSAPFLCMRCLKRM